MRRIFLALALLAAASAATAKEDKPKSQFIDKSVIAFPRTAGDYTLADTDYDPALFQAGVTSTWTVPGAPDELRLNIFVYPLGRMQENKAVDSQIAQVEEAVREAEKQQMYSHVEIGARTPFVVVARESTILDDGKKKAPERFDPTPMPEPVKTEPAPDADPILAALARNQASPNSHGIRQGFRFTRKDGEVARSLGYMFYRHLFGFKVRISVPESVMEQPAFEALADAAVRNIVPRIDVQNFGSCGTIEIPAKALDGKKDTDSSAITDAMFGGFARIKAESCANAEGKNSAAPFEGSRIEIVYPEGTWKSD